MKIVQISDIHAEDGGLFRPDLMERVVEETNEQAPDLVAVAGDLTGAGYREEFEMAKGYLDRLECEEVVAVMGNHDARNVGHRYFEDLFGMRSGARTVPFSEGEAKVLALDSSKPDLDEGEVGREYYGWVDSEFRGWDRGPRILVVHHHILAVPGTGRDSNILRDAGDVMALLREVEVDLVLAGHRHVPYFWSISGVRVLHSGTAASGRIRGDVGPSYNVVELGPEKVEVTLRDFGADETPADGRLLPRTERQERLLSGLRPIRPVRHAPLLGCTNAVGSKVGDKGPARKARGFLRHVPTSSPIHQMA